MNPSRVEVLRLYKDLLRYSNYIRLTDKNYYKARIKEEFQKSKNTTQGLDLLYEVKPYYRRKPLFDINEPKMMNITNFFLVMTPKLFRTFKPIKPFERGIKLIDKSLVPTLNERDLEEQFIKGSGPGGSRVNKRVNCVCLIHKPTGLHVKVHDHRELHLNRQVARNRLQKMLDNLQNGENSIDSQVKKLQNESLKKKINKQKKLSQLKEKWKDSLPDYLPTS